MSEVSCHELSRVVASIPTAVVAVSGGVDSLTLSAFAHEMSPCTRMIHAVSPAVPAEATDRVRELAKAKGWRLRLLDAGEFSDPQYLANPANRCFFCKTNLYGSMAQACDGQLLSGTNLDDLSDWRPGLKAAEDHGVRHPFVEAGMTKADVRELARYLDLGDIADLPASPCLSSRVETGIPIEMEDLRLIDRVERYVREVQGLSTVRCRIRANGMTLELAAQVLQSMSGAAKINLTESVSQMAGRNIDLAPYLRGSAFLRGKP